MENYLKINEFGVKTESEKTKIDEREKFLCITDEKTDNSELKLTSQPSLSIVSEEEEAIVNKKICKKVKEIDFKKIETSCGDNFCGDKLLSTTVLQNKQLSVKQNTKPLLSTVDTLKQVRIPFFKLCEEQLDSALKQNLVLAATPEILLKTVDFKKQITTLPLKNLKRTSDFQLAEPCILAKRKKPVFISLLKTSENIVKEKPVTTKRKIIMGRSKIVTGSKTITGREIYSLAALDKRFPYIGNGPLGKKHMNLIGILEARRKEREDRLEVEKNCKTNVDETCFYFFDDGRYNEGSDCLIEEGEVTISTTEEQTNIERKKNLEMHNKEIIIVMKLFLRHNHTTTEHLLPASREDYIFWHDIFMITCLDFWPEERKNILPCSEFIDDFFKNRIKCNCYSSCLDIEKRKKERIASLKSIIYQKRLDLFYIKDREKKERKRRRGIIDLPLSIKKINENIFIMMENKFDLISKHIMNDFLRQTPWDDEIFLGGDELLDIKISFKDKIYFKNFEKKSLEEELRRREKEKTKKIKLFDSIREKVVDDLYKDLIIVYEDTTITPMIEDEVMLEINNQYKKDLEEVKDVIVREHDFEESNKNNKVIV